MAAVTTVVIVKGKNVLNAVRILEDIIQSLTF